ncbi:FUSC family protein [Bradyrhizobium sp. Gha]|uniref:FUSC family protein n=1 Tax=Bradyrhizobium sp. Gha TaxID=1855318 RepID=UPI0015A6B51B|nr:FUSC family protein [Bradyrhizobium sp. Gha]
MLPTIVAAAIAEFLVGGGLAGRLLTIVCAGVAALLGGYDRTAAIVTTRFTLFLIIAQSMSAATPHPAAMMALLTAGALWTALLWLLFGAVVRSTTSRTPILAEQGPAAAAPAKLARWRASLGRPAGWHFTLKLVSCLVAAEALDQTFPNHHLQWIALTVVILAQRRTNLFPIKVTQRALGAGAGVLLAGLCLAAHPSAWTLTGCIGLIAGTRPLLKSRHYVPIPR